MKLSFETKDLSYYPFFGEYYRAMINCTISVDGETFSKTYHTRYYFPDCYKEKDWTYQIHVGNWKIDYRNIYFRDCSKEEAIKRRKEILKELIEHLKTLEKDILQKEKEHIPIINKLVIKRQKSGYYMVKFYIWGMRETHYMNILLSKGVFYQSGKIELMKKKNVSPAIKNSPTYYFEDHLFEQITSALKTYSKERVRLLGAQDKRYKKASFTPSHYPVDKIKIHYLSEE